MENEKRQRNINSYSHQITFLNSELFLILSFIFKESLIRNKNKVSYFFSETSEPPWTLDQVIWTFCFSLILVVSILGNTIVLWIILGMDRL